MRMGLFKESTSNYQFFYRLGLEALGKWIYLNNIFVHYPIRDELPSLKKLVIVS